jgi:hypothetical protein
MIYNKFRNYTIDLFEEDEYSDEDENLFNLKKTEENKIPPVLNGKYKNVL